MLSPCRTFKLFGGTNILILSVLTALLICYFISRWKNRRINAFMASIPGPVPLPIFGTIYTLFGVTNENLCDSLRNLAVKYPKTAAHWFFNEPVLVTSDPEILNAVWANPQLVDKIPEYKRFEHGFKGIFTANLPEWRTVRRMLNPCFRTNILVGMDDIFSRHIKTFLDRLEKHAEDEKDFDILPHVQLFSMATVLDFTSGMNLEFVTQKHDPESLAYDMRKAAELLFERVASPMFWPNWTYALSGKKKVFDDINIRGREILQNILDTFAEMKRNNNLKAQTAYPRSPKMQEFPTLMEVVLKNVEQGVVPPDHPLEEMVEMSEAGTLTTSGVVSWIFQILAMFPDIQEKAYQEVIETTGGREVIIEDLSKLTYIEMIMKETLRHTTVPMIARQLTMDLKVNDKMTIPAGMRLVMAFWTLHHDPLYWEKPGAFYPEHFSEANERKRPKGAFVPFSSGARDCPGYRYSIQSMKIVVANTLRHYKLSTTRKPPEDFFLTPKFRWILTLFPAEGYSVQVRRRSSETK